MSHHSFKPKPCEAHTQFIEDLGGPKALADEINYRLRSGLTGQAISNWKRRGIPYRYRGVMIVIANERDVSTPPNFFGTQAE